MTQNLENPQSWHGIWTALVSPLIQTSEDLRIDVKSLEKIIESQISSQSLTGLVIAGSTGEGSLLSENNYRTLLSEAMRIVNDRLPLVAGIGIGGTESALYNAKIAKEAGYQAILASPPAYIKTPQRGLVQHYLALAEIGLPICIYEVAGRAASSIQNSTIQILLNSNKHLASRFVAIKDASGDLLRALESVEFFSNKLALLSGDDFTLQPFLATGGNGAISVASHLIPKRMHKIYQSMIKKDFAIAANEQNKIRPLVEALFWESNPIPVKSAYFKLGQITENLFAPPLVPMDPDKLEKLVKIFKDMGDS